jgi:DNA-binding NarL/FixJ family response regulator
MEPIRLLLLDDHVLFREGLSRLLASESDFRLVGHCGASAEALDFLRRRPVDVVLLDFDLGDSNCRWAPVVIPPPSRVRTLITERW